MGEDKADKQERKQVEQRRRAEADARQDPAVADATEVEPLLGEDRVVAFDRAIPWGVQVAAGWSWRLLVIAALVIGAGYVLAFFTDVSIPVAVALLLAALLQPMIDRLTGWGCPRILAVIIGVVGGLLIVLATLTLIIQQIVSSSDELAQSTIAGVDGALEWLAAGPLHIDQAQIDGWIAQLTELANNSRSVIASYAAAAGARVGNFFAGLAIALFTLFFLLYEGRKIWNFVLRLVPSTPRLRVDVAARSGWNSLKAYVRATVLVALVDAFGVLAFALGLQVPLAPALAALVFIGAFVPIVGALVTGFVAVAVALVTLGWVQALIMLGGIILVMQLESNFLQPFLLGKAVSLHPLAVILGLTVGIGLAGILGGLFAIPVIAFGKAFVDSLNRGDLDVVPLKRGRSRRRRGQKEPATA